MATVAINPESFLMSTPPIRADNSRRLVLVKVKTTHARRREWDAEIFALL
jgi:hypothetical protein